MWHTKKLMLLFANVIVSVKLCEQAPLSGLKPGQCPVNAISNNNIGDCSAKTVNLECFLDTNCNGTKKCCRSGCALTCIEPDTPDMAPSVKPKFTSKEPSSPKVRKLGKCPPIPKGIECPNYDPYKAVKMECFYHDDCDKSKLCCLDPCDLKCLNPVPSPTPTPSVYRKEASTKPGQCPRLSIKIQETLECPPSDTLKHECVIDRDCDQDEKCCSDGCSFKCRQPVSITTVKPTTTVDVREASTKPGQCPRLSIKIQETLECPDTLKHECVIDGDCDQEEKCCSDGCSFKCRQPVSITTVKPTTTVDVREPSKKPGKCPRLSIEAIQGIIECPPPYPPIHECIVDRDCDENEKCCSDGCSFKCTQPVSIATVEPTTAVELTVDVREKEWKKCPKILSAEERRKIECSSERHIDCVVHWDCTGGKICCATMDGCDWRCMLPATDSSQKRPAEPKNSRMKTTTDPQTKPTTAPQMKSTTVKQVPMSTGGPPQVSVDVELPRSCLAYKRARISKNGYYPIFDENDDSYTAYCDFNSEPRSAWTLVMSWAFLHSNTKGYKHAAFQSSFKKNIAVSEEIPNWNAYRLSKERMRSLKIYSTHWRTTCSFPIHKVDYRDYVRANFNDFNIMKYHGKGVCKKVEYVNIGGNTASQVDVLYLQNDAAMFHVRGSSYDKKCAFKARAMSVSNGESFGWYNTANKQFRCTSGSKASTQYWFGGYTQ